MEVGLRLAPFFFLILCGAVLARTRRIDLVGARALSAFVFWLAAPALLLHSLAVTAPPDARDAVDAAAQQAGVTVTRIGTIVPPENADAAPAITWRDAAGNPLSLTLHGFDHFHAD